MQAIRIPCIEPSACKQASAAREGARGLLHPMRYFLLFLALLGAVRLSAATPRKPNIIHFIIDELGYYELSHMGHPAFRTPNIARVKKFAEEAHRPMPAGEIYGRKLLEKDRNCLGSEAATMAFRKNNKG